MSKVLIIGAGGVGTVVAHKVAQHPEVFTEVMIASRTQSKCDAIVKAIGNPNIKTAKVDADNVDELVTLFNSFKPEIVINVALPYQDLTIMEACLKAGVNYLDTANYEPKDEAHFEYSWQSACKKRFEEAGLTAILGCGFDPGVSGVYTAYAAKHHFDEIQYLDIVDCNAGNHHKAFATNFNPEINIREITQNGRYYENGQWITTQPLEFHKGSDLSEYRSARLLPAVSRRTGITCQELSDYQACTLLDDFRTRIPDSPACDPEHRYGQHRTNQL